MSLNRIKLIIAVFIMSVLLAAGVLTRDVTGAQEIATSDRFLMFMQRMGPQPGMIDLYKALAADTVTIRDPRSRRLISTGLYAGDVAQPRAVPGVLQELPIGIKRFIQVGESDSDLVYFVAPARGLAVGSVRVDTPWKQLDGAVITTDRAADLAAIVVSLPASEVANFYVPLPADRRPAGTLSLRMLLLHRPARYVRSASFVLTRGSVAGGTPECDTPVSGPSAGSPLVYISPAGKASLLGLAIASSAPDRCAVIGSWVIGQFMRRLLASADGGR